MGRSAKPIGTEKGHRTKKEKTVRKAVQDKVKGEADKIAPAPYLNMNQKKIFKQIVKHLECADILGNCDNFILNQTAIAIDRLEEIEKAINDESNAMLDKNLLTAKDRYSKDFLNGVNHLGLSPTSRAKLGSLAQIKESKESDPLLKVLGD